MVRPADRRAVSEVIGVVVLVAIVALLGVTVGTMVLGFEELQEPAPAFAGQTSYEFEVGPDGGTDQRLRIRHVAGDSLSVDDLSVRLRSGGESTTRRIPAAGDLSDGEWRAGESARVPLATDEVCTGDDEVDVRVVYEGPTQSAVLADHRVPISRSSFAIEEGTVRPNHPYTAEVRVLGTGFTYGTGGPRIPIGVRPTVGGTVHAPWPGDVNDGANPRTWETADLSGDTEIGVTAEASSYAWFPGQTVRSTDDHGAQVRVLRDGDPVPDVEGMGDQTDAAGYVDDYVEDGEITLAGNQAIFLFELGTGSPDDAAYDLQDVVVLVSMWSATDGPAFVEDPVHDQTIVCPEDD